MSPAAPHNPVFVALDTQDVVRARAWATALSGIVGGLKLGLEFFAAPGPDGVRGVMAEADAPLFLDLKFHDIPNTVAGAVASSLALGPAVLTVHAGGGTAMMRAAREAAGASHLVVGRPVTGSDDPAAAARVILDGLPGGAMA